MECWTAWGAMARGVAADAMISSPRTCALIKGRNRIQPDSYIQFFVAFLNEIDVSLFVGGNDKVSLRSISPA
jgi:hypothetical protein